MPKQRPAARPRPSKQAVKAGKVLRRAIDKSDIKEPPTVGKPVIEEPVNGNTKQVHRGSERD